MSDTFELRFELEDGYAGKSRPQRMTLYAGDFEEMTLEEAQESVYEAIADWIAENVTGAVSNGDALDEWFESHGIQDTSKA